jgi:cytochrome P450
MPAPTLEELTPDGHDFTSTYPVYATLRAKGPVHRVLVPGSGESWLVVAHDAARAALTDPRLRNDIRHSSSWRSDGGHVVGRFPGPDRFDLRRHTRAHLAFGHGSHHCLGAPLARAEAAVALRLLLRHRRALASATDPGTWTWRSSTLLRGLAELPLRFG